MKIQLLPSEQQICAAKILIVDDETADIRVLEWALRAAKFTNIRSMTDSAKVLEVFNELQPDLVLLDLYMPAPDGFALLKLFRETESSGNFLPVLAMTGNDTAETRQRAIAAGASDFLGKPIACAEVLLRIKNLLQTRFLHQQAREMQKYLEGFPTNGKSNARPVNNWNDSQP